MICLEKPMCAVFFSDGLHRHHCRYVLVEKKKVFCMLITYYYYYKVVKSAYFFPHFGADVGIFMILTAIAAVAIAHSLHVRLVLFGKNKYIYIMYAVHCTMCMYQTSRSYAHFVRAERNSKLAQRDGKLFSFHIPKPIRIENYDEENC